MWDLFAISVGNHITKLPDGCLVDIFGLGELSPGALPVGKGGLKLIDGGRVPSHLINDVLLNAREI